MSAASNEIATVVSRMQPDDVTTVNQLFCEIVEKLPYYNEMAKRSEIAKYSVEALLGSSSRDPDSVLVAKVGNQVVGFCFSNSDDGLVWLAWFGVHSSFRRQGVGSVLLEKLEQTVRGGRSHKIWCDCRTENEASKFTLSKHGYLQICTVRNHWYGQDFILWEKLVA